MVLLSSSSLYNSNEVPVAENHSDSVSSLEFTEISNIGTFLLSSSWDGTIHFYQVAHDKTSKLHMKKAFDETKNIPILDSCWYHDNSKTFSVFGDNTIKAVDIQTQQVVQVGTHDLPAKNCHFVNNTTYSCLVTSGFDNKVKFWDLRQQTAAFSLDLGKKIYCSDIKSDYAVFATADKVIHSYDIQNQPRFIKNLNKSDLNGFITCIKVVKNSATNRPAGFIAGTSASKVVVDTSDSTVSRQSFNFLCHNKKHPGDITDVYSVNTLDVHPIHGTIVTAGSDGEYMFWDFVKRSPIRKKSASSNTTVPITKVAINSTGNLLAIARGYDWSLGHAGYTDNMKPGIFITGCYEEMKNK